VSSTLTGDLLATSPQWLWLGCSLTLAFARHTGIDMRYDPDIAPSAPLWLSLEEARRIALVEEYHDATALPNARVHAAIHTAVENQIAMNLPSVVAAVARLQAQGLDRHDTVHAIGSVLATHMWGLLRGNISAGDPTAEYFAELDELTVESWRRDYG